jgi:hypothetical protein
LPVRAQNPRKPTSGLTDFSRTPGKRGGFAACQPAWLGRQRTFLPLDSLLGVSSSDVAVPAAPASPAARPAAPAFEFERVGIPEFTQRLNRSTRVNLHNSPHIESAFTLLDEGGLQCADREAAIQRGANASEVRRARVGQARRAQALPRFETRAEDCLIGGTSDALQTRIDLCQAETLANR